MGSAPREIEQRAFQTLKSSLAEAFEIQLLPELFADFAVQPKSSAAQASDLWLPIQLKASESADQAAWIRQIRYQLVHRADAYHGSILIGTTTTAESVLIVPVHRLEHWAGCDLLDPKWWIPTGDLPTTLEKLWKARGCYTRKSLGILATTSHNSLIESTMRREFAAAFDRGNGEFFYETNSIELTAVDGFLGLKLGGKKLRVQEKTGKIKRRIGTEIAALTISTARKGEGGYSTDDVDLLAIHVRKTPSATSGLLGSYIIPAAVLMEKGYAPKSEEGGSSTDEETPRSWSKTLNVYPPVDYIEKEVASWTDDYFFLAEELPEMPYKLKLFPDEMKWTSTSASDAILNSTRAVVDPVCGAIKNIWVKMVSGSSN